MATDTDGDGKADEKTVVASDYGVMTDPQRPLLANPWIYLRGGRTAGGSEG